MASAYDTDTSRALSATQAEDMTKYAITRVPVDYFHYRQFRYTNVADAIAQARRDEQRQT
jgi:hypothetical protein